MKTKKNLIAFLFVFTMIQSLYIKSQNLAYKEAPANKGWQALKLDDQGVNIKNGVEFYSNNAECNSLNTKILRLVNTNAFAVKVSYQVSAESSIINVMVPASATLEGSCVATDGNLSKLVIIPPMGKTDEEKQKTKEFLRAHITVTQIQ